MLNEASVSAVLLTLQVATVATVIALVPGVLMGYVLARFDFWGKRILSSVVGVTLVLPPTAVGYLLLQLLAPAGILGRDTLGIDLDLLLTWKGAVLAAIVMSLPLVVRTARVALEAVDPRLEEM
ncbi:MAG: ABC transporter permease subunit, partial [Gammaproteobacteria bacterium]